MLSVLINTHLLMASRDLGVERYFLSSSACVYNGEKQTDPRCLLGTCKIMHGDIIDPINLGSADLVTIDQLLDMVEDIAEVKLERRYNLEAPQGVRGRNSNNRRIKRLLNWEPGFALKEGLVKTYNWIYEQMTR